MSAAAYFHRWIGEILPRTFRLNGAPAARSTTVKPGDVIDAGSVTVTVGGAS
jgi:hypothetical protein